jgi:LysR family transcriptional regulator, hydrogen peroxide-inducible genes activator
MPRILKPLKKCHSQMNLVLSEELTDTLLNRLDKYEIDAVLLASPVDEQDFESIPLFDEPFWLTHPRNHRLADKKKLSRRI